MSAFLVDKYHIDLLVATGIHGPSDRAPSPGNSWYPPPGCAASSANFIGSFLWGENLKSVAYRYPKDKSGARPGPAVTDEEITAYSFDDPGYRPTAVQALKAISCYEYQSCEHPEWEDSEAKRFCEMLTSSLINALPGYDEAPWEWTA